MLVALASAKLHAPIKNGFFKDFWPDDPKFRISLGRRSRDLNISVLEPFQQGPQRSGTGLPNVSRPDKLSHP